MGRCRGGGEGEWKREVERCGYLCGERKKMC